MKLSGILFETVRNSSRVPEEGMNLSEVLEVLSGHGIEHRVVASVILHGRNYDPAFARAASHPSILSSFRAPSRSVNPCVTITESLPSTLTNSISRLDICRVLTFLTDRHVCISTTTMTM